MSSHINISLKTFNELIKSYEKLARGVPTPESAEIEVEKIFQKLLSELDESEYFIDWKKLISEINEYYLEPEVLFLDEKLRKKNYSVVHDNIFNITVSKQLDKPIEGRAIGRNLVSRHMYRKKYLIPITQTITVKSYLPTDELLEKELSVAKKCRLHIRKKILGSCTRSH